jgi:hypothetical protein
MPAVQSLTGKDWAELKWEEISSWGKEYDDTMKPPPGYAYLVYLRHHGFPSPLLDWSRSRYVAAFFAFRHQLQGKRVAIYAYLASTDGTRHSSSDRPSIEALGPYVKSHPRHVLQQCEYTTCSRYHMGEWRYASHEQVFEFGEPTQDLLWKFTLPASLRLDVLRRLDEANLNAYSLFPTEEALLEATALRELEFGQLSWVEPPTGPQPTDNG